MTRPPRDTHAIRVRPGRGSRPRSKLRPTFPDAVPATVVAVDRGRFTCAIGGSGGARRTVTAVKARDLGRKGVVVGDEVRLHGDTSGGDGALARIVAIEPRSSELRRTADDSDPRERVIVANVDQMAIVTSTSDPPPRPGLIDRCLVAAFAEGVEPLLLITKVDLSSAGELVSAFEPLGVRILEIEPGDRLDAVGDRLAGRRTVLVGHSGVGKSTLVNGLAPEAGRQTGSVNAVTGRGRHVSTSVEAFSLPRGGWVIDTPGVRSFGLGHIDRHRVMRAFPDLAEGAEHCPRGCAHRDSSCGLDGWVAAGHARPERLASLRRILAALDTPQRT